MSNSDVEVSVGFFFFWFKQRNVWQHISSKPHWFTSLWCCVLGVKSGWLPPPPALPPRPSASQVRSSCYYVLKSTKSALLFRWTVPQKGLDWSDPFPRQVSPFVNVSEKTPQNKVQQPNFADFSRFREEVSIKGFSWFDPNLKSHLTQCLQEISVTTLFFTCRLSSNLRATTRMLVLEMSMWSHVLH